MAALLMKVLEQGQEQELLRESVQVRVQVDEMELVEVKVLLWAQEGTLVPTLMQM